MSETPILHIKNWSDAFESSESRKLAAMAWVRLPTCRASLHYRRLVNGPDGPAIYGCFCALVGIAARAPVRGVLANDCGAPLTTGDLALLTGIDSAILEKAVVRLTDKSIAWLEWRPCPGPSPDVPGEYPDAPGDTPDAPGKNRGERRIEERRIEESRGENTRSLSARWASDELESIYRVYPRKVGKPKALQAIRQALGRIADGKDEPADIEVGAQWPPPDAHTWLLSRTQRFAESSAGKAGKYCPHATTWYNGGRYSDDPIEWDRRADDGANAEHGGGAIAEALAKLEADDANGEGAP